MIQILDVLVSKIRICSTVCRKTTMFQGHLTDIQQYNVSCFDYELLYHSYFVTSLQRLGRSWGLEGALPLTNIYVYYILMTLISILQFFFCFVNSVSIIISPICNFQASKSPIFDAIFILKNHFLKILQITHLVPKMNS